MPETVAEKPSLTSSWGIAREFLSSRERASLLEKYGDQLVPGTIGIEREVNKEIRDSRVHMIDREKEPDLFSRIDETVSEMNGRFFRVRYLPVEGLSFLQLGGYHPDSHYGDHMDCFLSRRERPDRERKLSLMIQLTDPEEYSGGEFIFSNLTGPDPEELRAAGTLVVFPSFLAHRVTPVEEGSRFSLVGWIEGPPWK